MAHYRLADIPPGTKVVMKTLSPGLIAVKINVKNDSGEQLYGLYGHDGRSFNQVITFEELVRYEEVGRDS